ncbi:MAG: hypothetical protein JNL58_08300 [Planctomyces sp.]|nr:hypothetical protein [Planctomyces sp.]
MRRTKKAAEREKTDSPEYLHPAARFIPATSMTAGSSLKDMFDASYVDLLSESLETVLPGFSSATFRKQSRRGLTELELKARAKHLGAVIREHLPSDFSEAIEILTRSLGPELTATGGNGMAPFFYMPHSCVIEDFPKIDLQSGMQFNHELTRRFTAEFSIRRFIIEYPEESISILSGWTHHANPHVRRLVSEGTRSRLPWGLRLKVIQQNPMLTVPLLEQLKDDPELYVRRSVANHIGDMLKDCPQTGYEICRRWVSEVRGASIPDAIRNNRYWVIRHAVRLPAKQGESMALKLRQDAASGKQSRASK